LQKVGQNLVQISNSQLSLKGPIKGPWCLGENTPATFGWRAFRKTKELVPLKTKKSREKKHNEKRDLEARERV